MDRPLRGESEMKRRPLLSAALAASILAAMPALARDLVEYPPRSIGESKTQDEWVKIIEKGGMRHNWKVVNVKPGCVRLKHVKGVKFMLTQDVFFEADRYWIKYVDSYGLEYESPKNPGEPPQIHRTYHRWTRNLDAAIFSAAQGAL